MRQTQPMHAMRPRPSPRTAVWIAQCPSSTLERCEAEDVNASLETISRLEMGECVRLDNLARERERE